MKKDIYWNSLGTAAWSFSSLFLLIVVTQINGIYDSGLFSFAFAIGLIMFTVSCYGGRVYQVSDHANRFSADTYISLRLLTSLAAVILTLIFVTINDYEWYKASIILVLVGHRVFDAVADVFYGILQKKGSLYVSGKSLLYKSILSVLAFSIVDILTKNLLFSSLALPVISLLFIIFYDTPKSRKLEVFNIKPKTAGISEILRSTFLPFIITVMSLVFVNLARYFIDIFHPDLQGYFGIIVMPLSLVILLFSFISTPIVVNMTKQYHEREFGRLNKSIGKIIVIMSMATIPLCVAAYLVGVPLLQMIFGVSLDGYAFDIMLVILIGLAVSLSTLFTNIAIIARKLRIPSVIYVLSNILLSVLCIAMVEEYQIRGAIVSYVIASALLTIVSGTYYKLLLSNYRLSRSS